jgi:hypothetical protein
MEGGTSVLITKNMAISKGSNFNRTVLWCTRIGI